MKEEIKEITIKFSKERIQIFHIPEKIPFWDLIDKLQNVIYQEIMNYQREILNKKNDN